MGRSQDRFGPGLSLSGEELRHSGEVVGGEGEAEVNSSMKRNTVDG